MSGDGWAEWSRHVLKELERLNDSHEVVRTRIEDIQQSITEMKSTRVEFQDLKDWKKEIDEVTSPTQLKALRERVTELESFRIKATTIFILFQGLLGLGLTILALLK